MINPAISVANFCKILNQHFGKGSWGHLEPETVMIEFETYDPIIYEKFRLLQAMYHSVTAAISLPEVLLWASAVMNNEPAEFEWIQLPTSLEMAWTIRECKKLAQVLGQPFKLSRETEQVIEYVLKEDGFSKPTMAFSYITPTILEPGATDEDMLMKQSAIVSYLAEMEKVCNV